MIHYRNLKFRNQIIMVFLIVFLLISVESGIAFYHISAKQITDNFVGTSKEAISQIENTLETRLNIINGRAESMLINNTFSTVVAQYLNAPTNGNTVKAQGIVSDYLKDFERGEALINSSYLYTDSMSFDTYVYFRKQEFDFKNSLFCAVYETEPAKAVQWFPAMENIIYQKDRRVIPCVRRFTVSGYMGWQYFVYQLDLKQLQELIIGQHPFFDDIVIIDQNGNKILGGDTISEQDLLELWDDSLQAAQNHTEYLVEGCYIKTNGWKVFGLKSKDEMLTSLGQLRADIFKVILVLLAVSIALVALIAKHMTDALNRLEYQMRCAQNGDFNVRFFYPYKDEIGSLSKCFNYMIEEIQILIKKQNQSIIDLRVERDHVEEVQTQKRKAELKALQAQINPHFLYNTLNTITWQVADKGMDDVSLMASSLGKFFRLSLSRGAEIISLSDEIEHVQCYLNIQGIRYQDKLQYQIDIPDQFLGCRVLKLILQPLVENAIYHGIKEKKRRGKIEITAFGGVCNHEPAVYLSVWDNGAGIPKEKLAMMNQGLKDGVNSTGEGYGIYNVNERIMLYYGSFYGLLYESEEGCYTKATLTIPMNHLEGD